MGSLQLRVHDEESAVDLREWLSAHGYVSQSPGTGTMGASEIVIISAGSIATARAVMLVLVAWIRARRTTVELTLDADRSMKLDTNADPTTALQAIRPFFDNEGRDDPQ